MELPFLSRRDLLRGSLGLAVVGGLGAAALTPGSAAAAPVRPFVPAPDFASVDADVYGVTTRNPLVEQRADPFITPRISKRYYFTGSVPEYDRIVLRGSPTLAGLHDAEEVTIWTRPETGLRAGYIWAPELHRIKDRWYVYFAAGDSDNPFNVRINVLESRAKDPLKVSAWKLLGQVETLWDSFALDATTFRHKGRQYLVWAQSEPELAGVNSSLYISRMASPSRLKGEPVRIATPTKAWETEGFAVNEGPAVLKRNGRIFITFSASATDARYAMGLLTADDDDDLLDHASWSKSGPVFSTWAPTSRYGPGHNSFTVAEDGETDVLVYHARDYRDITGDPLYDPNRHARVQRLYWSSDGTPAFGVPVGEGGPIVRLSPADAPASFVRHFAYVLRVDAEVAGTDLADSQFRFVDGLAGAGTVSLTSVNFPDRFVRVDSQQVRIDPREDGAGFAKAASFRRVATSGSGRKITLELDSAPGTFLTHDGAALTVGPAAGKKTTFRLG